MLRLAIKQEWASGKKARVQTVTEKRAGQHNGGNDDATIITLKEEQQKVIQ